MTLFTAAYDAKSVTDVLLAAVLGAGIFAAASTAILVLLRVYKQGRAGPRPETHAPIVREAKAPVATNPVRDVKIDEALAYLATRKWDNRFFNAVASGTKTAGTYDQLMQAAADGLIPIWGKRESYAVHEPIPREFWYNNRFEWFGLLKGDAFSESSTHAFSGDRYLSLMTSRASIECLTPPITDDLISLRDAAIEVYSEIRGTDMADTLDQSEPERTLDMVGGYISFETTILVTRPPSTKLEEFPADEKSKTTIADGATTIKYFGETKPYYTNPTVRRADLPPIIAEMKNWKKPK